MKKQKYTNDDIQLVSELLVQFYGNEFGSETLLEKAGLEITDNRVHRINNSEAEWDNISNDDPNIDALLDQHLEDTAIDILDDYYGLI